MADAPDLIALALVTFAGQRALPLNGKSQGAAGDASLLRLEMPLETMTAQLPWLEADWIADGETVALLSSLDALTARGWTINIAKHKPIGFLPWP